jgi:hypothetical protein
VHELHNKSLKQDKKQLVFARASLILTNYFLPLNEALVAVTCSNNICFNRAAFHIKGLVFVSFLSCGYFQFI